MRIFVVPDLHGELGAALDLLTQEKLINWDEETGGWERTDDDVTVVQLGDGINAVAESVGQDRETLIAAPYLFDVYLCGNHEHPYLGGTPFSGFWRDSDLHHRVKSLFSSRALRVAFDADGVLITHAGVTTSLQKLMGWETAATAASELDRLWWKDPTALPFDAIGYARGGWGGPGWGGVLWADWNEYKTPKFKQLVGHSVGREVRWQAGGRQFAGQETVDADIGEWEAICIDLGGGKHSDHIAGAWIEDGEVRLVTCYSPPGRVD